MLPISLSLSMTPPLSQGHQVLQEEEENEGSRRDQDQSAVRKPRRYRRQRGGSDGGIVSIVRSCSDCKTTKTPLWRSGPSGPKTLCNACGIRQRKVRRAVAAATLSGGAGPARAAGDRARIGGAMTPRKKLCFDDVVLRLSRSSAFQRVFPQDEKDAAILLMAISSGLEYS